MRAPEKTYPRIIEKRRAMTQSSARIETRYTHRGKGDRGRPAAFVLGFRQAEPRRRFIGEE
jgi:hypothetical protein